MIDFQHYWRFLTQLRRRMSDAMYVPSETGSHDMGDHYLGDMASAYVEIQNFPEAGRKPFHRIQVHVGSGSKTHQ
jgi:hypothetical protein